VCDHVRVCVSIVNACISISTFSSHAHTHTHLLTHTRTHTAGDRMPHSRVRAEWLRPRGVHDDLTHQLRGKQCSVVLCSVV
jgi:hypothetical protein